MRLTLRSRSVPILLLTLCLLCVCVACASKEAKLPETPSEMPFPEVVRIVFTGNAHFSHRLLRKVMASKQKPLLPPWKHGEPYNPPTLEADLRRLKKFYFDRGFLDTTVHQEEVSEDREAHTVSINIRIEEGPPTLVTMVQIVGTLPAELPPVQKLLAALPLRPQAPITKDGFDRSQALLLRRLHNAGYARAQVVPRTEVDTQAHTAAVSFALRPGQRVSFGRITIKGAKDVQERAIRRHLTIGQGQRYSAAAVDASADAIYGLGAFQAVTPRALNPEEDGAPLHMEIAVQERKPRTLQFGIGFSTVERFRISTQWTHRNLLGGAQQLTLLGALSSPEQKVEASLHLPYFLRQRMTLTLTLFARNQQEVRTDPFGLTDSLFNIEDAQPAFDLFSAGGEGRIGYRFTDVLSGAVGLELSVNNFSNVDPDALAAAGRGIADDNVLLLHFTELQWNTSDSLLNPTRGMLVRGRVGYANTALLSDVSFVKLLLEVRHYQPLWWGMILASRIKIGGLQPYGATTDVPFNVRFFAGGPGSVRGFTLNRLGPLDADGDPIGGNSLIEGSVELRFPLIGALSGALFVDFGNVFSEAFTYRLDELRYAVGPGVRYKTPVGPFRLDLGVIVDRRAGENFGRLELSIGQAF